MRFKASADYGKVVLNVEPQVNVPLYVKSVGYSAYPDSCKTLKVYAPIGRFIIFIIDPPGKSDVETPLI